ncbi:MAG TPA: phage holin family protein [Terriglobales bacterium]|nr:phage holin family protein [Terriglobales bacterium]
MQVVTENNRTIRDVVTELKTDARDFVSTRLQMLSQEMKEKVGIWKVAVPMLAVAALFGVVTFLALTFAFIAFFAGVFYGSAYAWCYGALIVTAGYFLIAIGMFYLGRRELTQAGLAPKRTLRVLKEDQIWIQHEARSQA